MLFLVNLPAVTSENPSLPVDPISLQVLVQLSKNQHHQRFVQMTRIVILNPNSNATLSKFLQNQH